MVTYWIIESGRRIGNKKNIFIDCLIGWWIIEQNEE